jgi:uncharacterized protein YkwD
LELNWRGDSFVRGPFTLEEMRDRLKTQTITGKTQVRCGNSAYWHPLREVSAIFTSPLSRTRPGSVRPRTSLKQKIVVIVIATVIAIFALMTTTKRPPTSAHTGSSFSAERLSKEAIIGLTNNARVSQGLVVLNENRLLDSIAEARARDMLEKQYFAHVSPTGEQASDIAQRIGYPYKIIAENIASGLFFTNQKLVDGWLQSPGHRKNILSSDVREMGASIIEGRLNGEDTWVSVQIFGLQSPPVTERACAAPSPELLKEMEIKKGEIASLNERVARLKQDLDDESDSIELERRVAGNDQKRIYDLNVRVRTYNEKSEWYNRSLAEIKGKTTVLTTMVEEYNKTIQQYRDCQASNSDHAG